MPLHRRWPPSKGYQLVRRQVYNFIKKNPYCTIEEITNAMGWNYLGGGIQTYGVLQELNNWNVIRKWFLYLWKPHSVKEFTREEKKVKKIYTIDDFLKLDTKERRLVFLELKKEELKGAELNSALHASGLMRLSEALERESGKIDYETIIVYKAKDGKWNDLKVYLYSLLKRSPWSAGEPRIEKK